MNLEKIHSVYFLGIGGIGMSALARWFHANEFKVVGYDKTKTPLTESLTTEGIEITYEDKVSSTETKLIQDSDGWLLIYTPAIPVDSVLKNAFLDADLTLFKRSQVLGFITEKYTTIAVAGTHGKTSTSCLLAHILNHAGVNCTAFMGGIASNYNSNLIMASDSENQIIVVEADEFDKSFLTLSPTITIVTTDDPDHLDIYGDEETFRSTFQEFASKIQKNGILIKNDSVSNKLGEGLDLKIIEYGRDCDVHSEIIAYQNGDSQFTYHGSETIEKLSLSLPGEHNVKNATAAITACLEFGLNTEQIRAGINSFQGVKRRFEYILRTDSCVFIDDYAHHPIELSNCLHAVKALFPNKKITLVFQPHLFSRTQDFMDQFAESLALVDELILLDIYPARELPIAGVNSKVLLEKIRLEDKKILSKADLVDYIKGNAHAFEVLLTVGAGDIGELVLPIKQRLEVAVC